MDHSHEPSEHESEEAGTFTLGATAVGCALGASMLAALPALLRAQTSERSGLFTVWLSLSAVALLPCLSFVLMFRAARAEFARNSADRTLRLGTLCLTLATTTALNVLCGAFLQKTTHHVGLAGATFGVFAVVALGFSYLVARRIREYASPRHQTAQRAYSVFGVLSLCFIIALCFLRLGRSAPIAQASALLDAFMLMTLSFLLSRDALRSFRPLRWVGPPMAFATLAIGALTLRAVATLEYAPLHSHVVQWVLGRLSS
jgi:drug/metabolite transporter (DMT)-like permease